MYHFDRETALTTSKEGHWSGEVGPDWGIGENPNGGYLVAIALQAMRQLAPEHPDPLSLTTHYLRPGVPSSPCEVRAERLRAGRSLSTVRGSLVQEDRTRVEVLAVLGDLGTGAEQGTPISIDPPSIPPPDACVPRSGEEQGIDLPILRRLDILLDPGEARAAAAGKAQVTGWIRFKDGRPPDSSAAVLFADAFPPPVFGLLGMVGWVPTIELTVHVRRRPAPGWMLGRFTTRDLADGRMVEDGLLWDESGRLVSQSRQIALVLPRGD